MHEVLVNRLGGLSLPRKSVVRLTDRPDMTLDVYRGRKTTIQQYSSEVVVKLYSLTPNIYLISLVFSESDRLFTSLLLVLCRVEAVKSLPVHLL